MKPMLTRALLTSALAIAAPSAFAQDTPQNLRGATTGPTTAPGFSHAEQYIHLQDVKPADNMYRSCSFPGRTRRRAKSSRRCRRRPARSRTSWSS